MALDRDREGVAAQAAGQGVLARPLRARWTFTLYPEAAEGGGCFQPSLRRQPVGGGPADVERSQQEAGGGRGQSCVATAPPIGSTASRR